MVANTQVELQSQWIYLPLGYEALALLKKGVVALTPLAQADKPWLLSAKERVGGLSDQGYIDHMRKEFERLPANLKSLISFEQFLAQAQGKRAAIERELMRNRREQAQQRKVQADNWALLDFYHDPFSVLSWQLSAPGFSGLWLALEARYWPLQHGHLQPLCCDSKSAVRVYQRLFIEPEELCSVGRSRLIYPPQAGEKAMTIAGRDYHLLRLPPKALRLVLFGHQLKPAWRQQFIEFWRSDFRYQRMPLAQMNWPAGKTQFDFSYV